MVVDFAEVSAITWPVYR